MPTTIEAAVKELKNAWDNLQETEALFAEKAIEDNIIPEDEEGWSPKQNELPASAFAIPRPDESPKGKLPHHNDDGSVNKGGVSAAIKRFHQTDASSEELSKAKT